MAKEKSHTEKLVPKLRFKEFNSKWVSDTLSGFDLKVIDGDRGTNYPNGDDFSSEGYCLFMNAKNVTKTGFSFEERVFISQEKDELLRKGKLKRNDLVLTTRGSVGNIAFYNSKVKFEHLRINSGMVIIRNESRDLDPNFIYSSFFSPKIDRQLKTIAFGSAQPQLTVSEINKFKFSIPSLPEQQKIASFLSAVDEKIQLLTRKKELVEKYKKGVMQKLFPSTGSGQRSGELRFKDEKGKDFPEWEEKRLGDVGQIVGGLTYSPENINDTGILVLRSSNVQDRALSFLDNVYVKVNEGEFNPVKENDILICVRNGSKNLIGKNAIIPKSAEGFAFGAFMAVFRSEFNKFLIHFFDSDNYKKQVYRNLGATINSINGSDLKKFKIPFPIKEEQKKIANYLSALDSKIEKINKQITQMQEFKKGLLQQMFV